jgi:hypothetical protein
MQRANWSRKWGDAEGMNATVRDSRRGRREAPSDGMHQKVVASRSLVDDNGQRPQARIGRGRMRFVRGQGAFLRAAFPAVREGEEC